MNILAISHLYPHVEEKRYGIFVPRQLGGLVRLGAEITVLVPMVWRPRLLGCFKRWRGCGHRRQLCDYEGLEARSVSYIRLPGMWYNRWSGLAAYRAMRSDAQALHASKRFDVIYATDFFPDGDAAIRLGADLGIPAACLGIGVDVNLTAHSSAAMSRHFKRVANGLDGTLACGQSVADGIDAVRPGKSLVVYGVIDLNEFCPSPDKRGLRGELDISDTAVVALYAGYLHKRKGVYELIEAFDRVCQVCPEAELVLCGDGEEKDALREMAQNRNIGGRVRFLGNVKPEKMSQWMKASDMFVLPSHTEGMPNVVMEAMACGLPVISTAVGGLPEAVGDCPGARLLEPEQVDLLAETLLEVFGHESLRQEMGIAARARAEDRFGVARNAKRILSYLGDVVAESKKV